MERIAFDRFVVDRARRQLVDQRTEAPVELVPRAVDALLHFVDRAGELVTKDELMDLLWPGRIVQENSLSQIISRLRAALDDDRRARRFIVTAPGRGYRFVAPIRPDGAPPVAAPPVALPPASVAVLPLVNMTGDPANDCLCDGLTEELSHRLSRCDGLRVPARVSTLAYAGRGVDAHVVGRELGVAAFLEGSVRAVGARIRVTAQLIDTRTGFHIWSERYDREGLDLFQLQDDLAGRIAARLHVQLLPQAAPTADPRAYELVLRALGGIARPSADGLRETIGLLRQAVALDPRYAKAYSLLARCFEIAHAGSLFPVDPATDIVANDLRAFALDPAAEEAKRHAFMALVGSAMWLEAAELCRASLAPPLPDEIVRDHAQINSPLVGAEYDAALYLWSPLGFYDRALAGFRRVRELAPQFALVIPNCAAMALHQGDLAETRRLVDAAIAAGFSAEINPIVSIRCELALAEGDVAAATEAAIALLPEPLRDRCATACRLTVAALAGRDGANDALAALDALLAAPDHRTWTADYPALAGRFIGWYARLGALDRAFWVCDRFLADWQRKGTLDIWSLFNLWSPKLRAFRADPRFQLFVEALGMVAFWERFGPPDGHDLRKGRLQVQ
jgi:TolB-like protein